MKKTLLAVALAAVSVPAAADSLIYGGLQVGSADYRGENSVVYGGHVGTGLLPFIGIEVGAWNLGSYDTLGTNTDVTSINAAIKPSIDFGPLHVYGKVGMHSWESKGLYKQDGFDPFYGFGAEFSVFPMVTVGAGYNYFKLKSRDIDFLSLNVSLHFL